MRFYIYLKDLKPNAVKDVKRILKVVLAQDIEKAVKAGMDRQAAEARLIDSRLDRHDFPVPVEL